MYAQKEKTKENKSRAVANSVAETKVKVKQGVGFVDNRPESIVMNSTPIITGICPKTKSAVIQARGPLSVHCNSSRENTIQKVPSKQKIALYIQACARRGISPSTVLKIDGWSFYTDKYARVTFVEGTIKFYEWGRVFETPTAMVKGIFDDNGHIIADSLGGPAHAINVVGMNMGTNRDQSDDVDRTARWRRMEAAAEYIAKSTKNDVVMSVTLDYDDSDKEDTFFRPVYLYVNLAEVLNKEILSETDNPTKNQDSLTTQNDGFPNPVI
jgi:hypothetical protein